MPIRVSFCVIALIMIPTGVYFWRQNGNKTQNSVIATQKSIALGRLLQIKNCAEAQRLFFPTSGTNFAQLVQSFNATETCFGRLKRVSKKPSSLRIDEDDYSQSSKKWIVENYTIDIPVEFDHGRALMEVVFSKGDDHSLISAITQSKIVNPISKANP